MNRVQHHITRRLLSHTSNGLRRVPMLTQIRKYEGAENQKYDPTRKQPQYDSPYEGHDVNVNNSGLPLDADLWWGDHKQQEYIVDDYPDWVPLDLILLYFFYFAGWVFSLWAFARYFMQPAKSMHPMATIRLSEVEIEEGRKLRQKRLEDMEKYGINENGERVADIDE